MMFFFFTTAHTLKFKNNTQLVKLDTEVEKPQPRFAELQVQLILTLNTLLYIRHKYNMMSHKTATNAS